MFISDPEAIITALLEIVDTKNSRISLSDAVSKLQEKGFDLGPTPQESLRALLTIVNPEVLNLRVGRSGGIGRPSNASKPQEKHSGLVALMRQALAEGKTISDLKKQLSELSE